VVGTSCGQDVTCPEITGLDRLLEPGAVVLLGEIHGTREAPAFTIGAVCRALELGRRVTLALEIPDAEEPRVDAYLGSSGDTEARSALLEGSFWTHASYRYGISSQAMVDLLERARVLGSETGRLDVRLFDRRRTDGSRSRDRHMAEALEGIVESDPEAVVIVLTGNIHARTAAGTSFEPMGYLLEQALPDRRIVALNLEHAGGSAWVCTAEGCGVHPMNGSGDPEAGRSVRLDETLDPRYDGVYTVGPLTPSPPASNAVP